ncbi:MAG: hypothetical protein ABIV51_00735 [Saprospiraceae bacterium]
MKRLFHVILLISLIVSSRSAFSQIDFPLLSVSPAVNVADSANLKIIDALKEFLKTKNNSASANAYWLPSDFVTYQYPYLDIYNIEKSKFGDNFYKPTLIEIIATENPQQKIVKIAFIGHEQKTQENQLRAIYNLLANIHSEKIIFSKYLELATLRWTKFNRGPISYRVSPGRVPDQLQINDQLRDINLLCQFFSVKAIDVTYYSCTNPRELFEIKGFDYNPMMYIDSSGGFAESGHIIFSGNNSEINTHEMVHIYTHNYFPNITQLLDEGLATYIAGSGKYDYQWHRNKMKKFLAENPGFDCIDHLDPFERLYFEQETPIAYMIGALICESTMRAGQKELLLEQFKSDQDIWTILKLFGLNKENLNEKIRKEIQCDTNPAW